MCDSFRDYMAPNELRGRRLKGADQAMMQAQDRLQLGHEACEAMERGLDDRPSYTETTQHDYKALRHFNKRLERGGGIFMPGQNICD